MERPIRYLETKLLQALNVSREPLLLHRVPEYQVRQILREQRRIRHRGAVDQAAVAIDDETRVRPISIRPMDGTVGVIHENREADLLELLQLLRRGGLLLEAGVGRVAVAG